MMKPFRNSAKIAVLAMALLICASGCKSSKKAAEAARLAAEKTRIEQEATLKKQQEEGRKKQAAEEQASRDAEAKRLREAKENEKESTPYVKLNQYFDAIASSGNTASTNNSINEALGLFASSETPVLIVISGSGDQKDYDKPTTIKNYLNYLKDQKKNINRIENLQFDNSGKITEVELRKN
jgi:hypothetical protein